MEVEEFIYDLAWKEHEHILKSDEILETKSQILMMVSGILIPLLYSLVPISNVWSKQSIIFIFPLLSFFCAFLVTLNSVSPIDIPLDKISKDTNEENLNQIKVVLAEKIGRFSEKAKKTIKTKVKFYLASVLLFGISIGGLTYYFTGL